MNLQDRFTQHTHTKPTEMQKMKMYQKFLDTSHRSISYGKVAYYTKVAVFSIGLFLLGGTLFYSLQTGTPEDRYIAQHGEGYMTLDQMPGTYVQAETIGEIIYTEGAIRITNDATEIETNSLSENDKVLLSAGAEMHFRIDEQIEAKIIGPAEFVLEDAGNHGGMKNYVINLISGDYLEIVTVELEVGEDNNIDTGDTVTHEQIPTQVSVKAADFTIEQVDTRGALDLVISTSDDGKKQVENKGSEVVVKKLIAQKQTYVAIQQNETVAVNGAITFVDEQDATPPIKEAADAQFAVRYTVENALEDKATEDVLSAADLLASSATPTKQVIPEELKSLLEGGMSSVGVQRYIDQMEILYTQNDVAAFTIAYTNLLQKLERAYNLGGVGYTSIGVDVTTIAASARAFVVLKQYLQETYYVDPSLLYGLDIANKSLQSLSFMLLVDAEKEIKEEGSLEDATSENKIQNEETTTKATIDAGVDEESEEESIAPEGSRDENIQNPENDETIIIGQDREKEPVEDTESGQTQKKEKTVFSEKKEHE